MSPSKIVLWLAHPYYPSSVLHLFLTTALPFLAQTMTCFKRAGADIILTYFAKEAARWLCEDGLR